LVAYTPRIITRL